MFAVWQLLCTRIRSTHARWWQAADQAQRRQFSQNRVVRPVPRFVTHDAGACGSASRTRQASIGALSAAFIYAETRQGDRARMMARWIASLTKLHRGAVAHMNEPADEATSTVGFVLTLHSFSFVISALLALAGVGVDIPGAIREAWPIQDDNFRNPLSVSFVCGMTLYLLSSWAWNRIGRLGTPMVTMKRLPYYKDISLLGALVTMIATIFVAATLRLPLIAMLLPIVVVFFWGRWTLRACKAKLDG